MLKTAKEKKIKSLAIANRGEVAVRIMRAAQELGIKTVLLHSDVDENTRAYRMADKAICIGPAPTNESYLNIEANIQGALAGGADAIHPGFGFLSENSEFAEKVIAAGLTFVGPSPESMRILGDKVECKKIAERLALPLVPGYQGENQTVDFLVGESERIGYPVIVKAAAGGGGRGMKVIRDRAEAFEQIESAKREALSAFGDDKVFLEKYLDRAKHIEFQMFGDAFGEVMHLYDRECSVQRRHQKIIEEAVSPSLTIELRRKMGEAAILLGKEVGYKGAGTVEFLLQDGKFYLLEVNTRLQVEHCVTEMVIGVDLVKAQILTAQGLPVFSHRDQFAPTGHSIECRIYAEDPYLGGVPSTGKLGTIEWPEGPGRRFEYGFENGDTVTSYYDSMIAKVIVWDETRTRTIQKMIRTLQDSIIFGVRTNIPYLIQILSHPEFVKGTMTTGFIGQHFSEPLEPETSSALQKQVLEKLIRQTPKGSPSNGLTSSGQAEGWGSPFTSPWGTSK